MKKLLSMLLVVAMIASMSLVAFAAETNTVSTEIVETDDGITVTVYVTNPVNVSGFVASLAFPSASVSTDKSYTLASDFAACSVTPSSKTGNVKFLATFGTATEKYVTKSGKVAMISFPLTRIDDSADLASAFAYGTSLYVAKINEGTAEYTSAKNADHFVAPVYVDDRTPVGGGETPEEPEGSWAGFEDTDKSTWTSESVDIFAYLDAGKQEVTGAYNGKKVIAFGKNASNKAYAAGEYGIKIGINEYPGAAPVEAGKVFAIVLIDTNNDTKVGDTSYTYSIWTIEDDKTVEKTNGLSAVIAQ